DDGRRPLVHGASRIDHLLLADEGPDCVAVLDWELSTIGHPFADLAALVMQWQRPPGAEGRGLAGVNRAPLGIPEDQAFIDAYCERAGLPGIPNFGFYLAFAFFRMGAILQGVRKRALDGNASNPELGLRLGASVPDYAAGGLEAARSI
ncbi:MAG: phosphotransferase, partial [Pseudomonadota bacterium]